MLTRTAIEAAKPREKPYRLADGRGLALEVHPNGAKLWRYRYRIDGREKQLSLGAYPDTSLKRAREKLADARELVADGVDPSAARRAERAARADSFATIGREYLALHARKLSASTLKRDTRILDKVIARLGPRPITTIEAPELLAALRTIEAAGTYETAHRALGLASRIYEYAIAVGKATRDPSSGLRGALAPVVPTSHAAITDPKALGALLRAIDNYSGQPATIAALKLLALLFPRPGELRQAQWRELDLDGGQWVVPAARTKMRRDHLVPLSTQAIAVLKDLMPITERGPDSLVLPSLRPKRPLSDNTLNLALRTMGYDGATHVAHSFRSTASTLLHEMGWDSQLIELQLAHADGNKVRAIYNRSERLAERKKLMQAWADYLDGLKAGADVVAIRDRG